MRVFFLASMLTFIPNSLDIEIHEVTKMATKYSLGRPSVKSQLSSLGSFRKQLSDEVDDDSTSINMDFYREKFKEDSDSLVSLKETRQDLFDDITKINKKIPMSSKATTSVGGDEDPSLMSLTSGNIEDFIADIEKFRAKAYPDAGRLSIGYGTKASSKDEVITEEEARKRLKISLSEAIGVVNRANNKHNYGFLPHQMDALASFTYNAGQGNFSKLIDKGNRGIEEIADSIELYNQSEGKVLQGLIDRRKKEYDLFTLGYK